LDLLKILQKKHILPNSDEKWCFAMAKSVLPLTNPSISYTVDFTVNHLKWFAGFVLFIMGILWVFLDVTDPNQVRHGLYTDTPS